MMSVCNASGIVLRTAHIFFYLMLTKALQDKYYQPLQFIHSFKTTFVIQLRDLLSFSGSCKKSRVSDVNTHKGNS